MEPLCRAVAACLEGGSSLHVPGSCVARLEAPSVQAGVPWAVRVPRGLPVRRRRSPAALRRFVTRARRVAPGRLHRLPDDGAQARGQRAHSAAFSFL